MNSDDQVVEEKTKIFISYSHEDREFAERLALALHHAGEDVWWDKWEIVPGDSLIRKIFEEGLSRAKAFILVLSPHSVRSKWVREELDVATVRRIEGMTRIIPVLRGPVDIPTLLRSLLWVDLSEDFEIGVNRIINAVHGVSAKPPRSHTASAVAALPSSHGGFSKAATAVAIFLLKSVDVESGQSEAFMGPQLADGAGLEPRVLNDAIAELSNAGLVRTVRTLGSAPFDFYQAEPTYVLFRKFSKFLDYDPEEDIKVVAATVASTEQVDGPALAAASKLSPGRINRAAAYLEDFGLVKVVKWFGTSPFSFGELRATHRTRQFVS